MARKLRVKLITIPWELEVPTLTLASLAAVTPERHFDVCIVDLLRERLVLDEPVDLVNVFRRADAILSHVPEILAMTHRPRFVWFQQGLRNEEAAAALEREGIVVVQDRCTLADHRAFFG